MTIHFCAIVLSAICIATGVATLSVTAIIAGALIVGAIVVC